MKEKRVERLNSEFKKQISMILANEVKDARLSAIVSIMTVSVTNDLSYADVYVSMLGDEQSVKESRAAVESSTGYIRKLLGQRMKIRHVPQLRFKFNDNIEEGIRISKLIDEVNRDNSTTE